jgi:RimJ/RimL family protein N-acetyltransferase
MHHYIGCYDGNKLVGMAQLYLNQNMLKEFKEVLDISNYRVCELGGNLVLPEYRGKGITTVLQTILYYLAKDLKFDYIMSMAHPDNKSSLKTLEKVGLEYIKQATVANGHLRYVYLKNLKY